METDDKELLSRKYRRRLERLDNPELEAEETKAPPPGYESSVIPAAARVPVPASILVSREWASARVFVFSLSLSRVVLQEERA